MGSYEDGITRRELGALVAAALAAAPQVSAQTAAADPVLDIAEWSYFWVGVEKISTARGTLCNGMQMYVEYWIPTQVRHPYPVVLVHGGYGQGADWISTPEGKRGWASLLVEQGYKVYVVDRPGQGRPPYFPWFHGYFDERAQTFEGAAKELGRDVNDPVVAQAVASKGQPMGNNAVTQNVWRTRGAMLLDQIGPAIFVTRGDGAVLASLTAQERPNLVKGIAKVEDLDFQGLLKWMDATAPGAVVAENNAHPNHESTALKLADQGCFWVGVQRKKMSYGTIPMGQTYVQYMIPAEKKHPYPVVMVHGGGGQGMHMMGIGRRPGWVHYFVQAGYAVYWIDRPGFGRSPYHPDALGPSHLRNVPPYEGLITSTGVFNTSQWPGPGGMNDPLIDQFMACEVGNVADEAFHTRAQYSRRGGVAGSHRALHFVDACVRRVLGMGGGGSAAEAGQGRFGDGDQREPVRGAVEVGGDGDADDLRSSGDGCHAVQVGGYGDASRFSAARAIAFQIASGAGAKMEELAGNSGGMVDQRVWRRRITYGECGVPEASGMFSGFAAAARLRDFGQREFDAAREKQSRSFRGVAGLAGPESLIQPIRILDWTGKCFHHRLD